MLLAYPSVLVFVVVWAVGLNFCPIGVSCMAVLVWGIPSPLLVRGASAAVVVVVVSCPMGGAVASPGRPVFEINTLPFLFFPILFASPGGRVMLWESPIYPLIVFVRMMPGISNRCLGLSGVKGAHSFPEPQQ